MPFTAAMHRGKCRAMPSIYRRGHVWYCDWYEGGTRRRVRVSPDKAEAQAYLAKRMAELKARQRGCSYAKTPGLYTWQEVWRQFRDNYSVAHHREATRKLQAYCWKRLDPYFGDKLIGESCSYCVEVYQAMRKGEGASNRTVNIEVALLKQLAHTALKLGWIGASPLIAAKGLPEGSQRARWLTPEEMQRVIRASSPQLAAIIRFAVSTGMRRGEIIGLTWRDVNWPARLVTLERTKTGKRRSVPLNDTALAVLKSQPRSLLHEHVFSDSRGHPFHDLSHAFKHAAMTAGVEDAHFHDLRHTFASWAVSAGVSLEVVRVLLGHADLRMTLRYSHLSPEAERAGVNRLDSLHYLDAQINADFA